MPCHDCIGAHQAPKGMSSRKKPLSSKDEKILRERLDRATRLLCGMLNFMKEEPGCGATSEPYQGCRDTLDVLFKDIEIAVDENFECEIDNVLRPLVDLKDWWTEHEAADICHESSANENKHKNEISKFRIQR